MAKQDWFFLWILSLLWGGSFVFVELALRGLPTLSVVWLRVAGAAVLLAFWLRLSGVSMPRGKGVWRALLIMGLLNNVVPFTLFVLAQGRIEGALAAIVNATTPLWTVLLAHAFTADERLTLPKSAGVALGFSGVIVMTGVNGTGEGWAILGCLAAALSYGLAGVWGRRFRPLGLVPPQVAFGQVLSSSLILAPVWLITDRPWAMGFPGAGPLLAVAGLAALSTALAYLIYFRLLGRVGATMLSLVTFLIPVSAVALGVVLLGEHLEARHMAGFGLICLGLLAIDGRVLRWRG
jgi:drug/metabolite transporter (DMT)-like permease